MEDENLSESTYLLEPIMLQYATADHLAPVYQGKGGNMCVGLRSFSVFIFIEAGFPNGVKLRPCFCATFLVPSFVDLPCRSFYSAI